MIPSARLRLTLSYLAIMMALSVLFSFALYRVSVTQLKEGLQRGGAAVQHYPGIVEFVKPGVLEQIRRDQFMTGRHQIMANLLLLNLGTLVVGGALSYVLARRTLKPIEAAMEAQSRFTADASHELRTPLTAMKSEIEVALRQSKLSSADAKALLTSNLEEVSKLEALSNGLLRLSQYQETIDPAALKPCGLPEIMDEASERVRKVAEARQITIERTTEGQVQVMGDRASLVELVVILLDNAIKYSPAESKVALAIRQAGPQAVVSVEDRGIGIKASDQPYIFNRFYRADRSRSKHEASGYGLGLSIAKRIVDLHRGTIAVASTPGHGTTFTIKLPRASA